MLPAGYKCLQASHLCSMTGTTGTGGTPWRALWGKEEGLCSNLRSSSCSNTVPSWTLAIFTTMGPRLVRSTGTFEKKHRAFIVYQRNAAKRAQAAMGKLAQLADALIAHGMVSECRVRIQNLAMLLRLQTEQPGLLHHGLACGTDTRW